MGGGLPYRRDRFRLSLWERFTLWIASRNLRRAKRAEATAIVWLELGGFDGTSDHVRKGETIEARALIASMRHR